MKRIFPALFVLLFIISFQSCKKESPANPDKPTVDKPVDPPTDTEKPDPSKIYLVSKITLSNHWHTDVQQLSYDNKNRLIEFKYKDINRLIWDRYEYTYDANNRMIKREYYDGYDKLINTYDYQYTSSETPKAGFIAVDTKNQITGIGTDYLVKYDNQGHILYYGSDIWYNPGEDHGLLYDNKNNPFKNIIGVNTHFNNEIRAFPAIYTNNLLNTFDNGNWHFVYNIDNFPTSASYINQDGYEIKVTYEYIVK